MRVMVIEDFKTMREILRSLLEQLGHEVAAECESKAEAISLLASDDFDLVVCDQTIKDGTAADFLAQHVNSEYSDIPVVIMGGASEKAAMQEAMKIGGEGLIVKPFTATALKEKLKKLAKANRAS